MNQPPSQAAVAAREIATSLAGSGHWTPYNDEQVEITVSHLTEIIDRHIPATDRAGWQGMESAPELDHGKIKQITAEAKEAFAKGETLDRLSSIPPEWQPRYPHKISPLIYNHLTATFTKEDWRDLAAAATDQAS